MKPGFLPHLADRVLRGGAFLGALDWGDYWIIVGVLLSEDGPVGAEPFERDPEGHVDLLGNRQGADPFNPERIMQLCGMEFVAEVPRKSRPGWRRHYRLDR